MVITKVHSESLETYGVPRIHAELADDYGIRVGRKRVARLMRQLGIEGVSRRGKRRYKTTIPAKEQPAAPDLVRRFFHAAAPNRLWVADITYVSTWVGFLFLACVIDAWSRRVVGWSMRDDLRSERDSTKAGALRSLCRSQDGSQATKDKMALDTNEK